MGYKKIFFAVPVRWSSGNTFLSGERSLRFKARASQIEHIFANGLQLMQHFFEKSCVDAEVSTVF